jgi:hypothetical protein
MHKVTLTDVTWPGQDLHSDEKDLSRIYSNQYSSLVYRHRDLRCREKHQDIMAHSNFSFK